MSQISKYPISKNIADRIFDIFLKSLVKIKNEKEAEEFISDFLTPTEKVMLAKRLSIAFLLDKGYDYRTIQKILRVSAPTITAVNISRTYGSKGYKKLIEQIIKEETITALFEDAITTLLSLPASTTKGGGTWKYLRNQVEKEAKAKRKIRDAL